MLLNLIAGHDERDTTSEDMPKKDYTKALKNDVKGLKIGVPKEFYGEGQQFFQAKRRGDKTILWTDTEGSKAVYVLPLPKSEIKFE